MKKFQFALFCLVLLVFACKKSDITTSDSPPIVITPTDTTLFSGSFTSAAHTTTGNVKLIKAADTKKYLVFDSLKTDAGPDLHIYLAEDKTARVYTDITSTVVNGNTKLEVPSTANTDKQKFVLIWCKQFSVLFGSAEMK